MKSLFIKSAVTLWLITLLVNTLYAQRRQSRTMRLSNRQQTKTVSLPVVAQDTIPYIIDSSTMVDLPARKSLKPTSSFGDRDRKQSIPLPYEYLRYDDALYAEKVWRDLDFREKINQSFRYDAEGDNGSQLFMNMLLNAVQDGQVAAFEDDRFSVPVSAAQIAKHLQGRIDTFPRVELNGRTSAYIITRERFDSKTISGLRIMEEWVFDNKTSRMHCRTIGIAPLKTLYLPDGKERPIPAVMFWVSYPDLRPMLANTEVYNPKNMGQNRMTWDELFESRMFSSHIVKSTIDNPQNKFIRNYSKDPALALLEGENIKDKIFNYEQDLWSY